MGGGAGWPVVVLAQAGALGAQEIARASDLIRQARMNREAAALVVSGAKEAADLLLSGGELSVDLSLYLQEGGSILSGGYGEVPQATGDAIVDAMMEVSIASPEIDVWINSLEQAGVNGYRVLERPCSASTTGCSGTGPTTRPR